MFGFGAKRREKIVNEITPIAADVFCGKFDSVFSDVGMKPSDWDPWEARCFGLWTVSTAIFSANVKSNELEKLQAIFRTSFERYIFISVMHDERFRGSSADVKKRFHEAIFDKVTLRCNQYSDAFEKDKISANNPNTPDSQIWLNLTAEFVEKTIQDKTFQFAASHFHRPKLVALMLEALKFSISKVTP